MKLVKAHENAELVKGPKKPKESKWAKDAQETQAGVLVLDGESKKEGVRGFEACTWSCQ